MTNLRPTIYSIITVCAATIFISCSSYAEVEIKELPCCTDSTYHPTRDATVGIPEIKQIATLRGIRIDDVQLPDELQMDDPQMHDVITINGDSNYEVWKGKLIAKFGAKSVEFRKLFIESRTSVGILASCSSSPSTFVRLEKPGDNIMCGEGDGITFAQSEPVCSDSKPGLRTVITIAKTKDEKKAQKQKEAIEAQQEIARLKQRMADRSAQIEANTRAIEIDRQGLAESVDRVLGGSRLELFSVGGGAGGAAGSGFGLQ